MRVGNRRGSPARRARGFTLLAMIAAAFILALSANQVMVVLAQQAQRDREAELLRIGQEMVAAIGSYYEQSPGNVRQFPAALEDLVEDRRFVGLKRHLRRVYDDPMTPGTAWGLVRRADGRIEGVFSSAPAHPIRDQGVDLGDLQLPPARRYEEWKFVYVPKPVATKNP